MLVLSRKSGEKLVIDGVITVTINRVLGNRVQIGVEAPREVRIVRGELKAEAPAVSVGDQTAGGVTRSLTGGLATTD